MKRILLIACAVILFLIAGIVTVYPLISNYLNEKYQSVVRTEYNEIVAQADDVEIQSAWDAAREYNAALQPVHFDAESMQEAQINYHDLLNLARNDIMGYVEIPKINIYLPICHGTGAEILDNGILNAIIALSIADEYTPTGRIGGKYGCRTSARKKRDLSHDPELHQRKRGTSNPDKIYRASGKREQEAC